MARRYSKRRYYKRKGNKRTFSRYNTYRYRSSKAQAYQIYSLNRKINRLESKTKPEFKTGRKDDFMSLTTPYQSARQLWNHSIKLITSTDGVNFHSEEIQKGLFARLAGLTIWGNIFRTDSNATHTAGFLRLIVVQYRQARSAGISMPDLFSGYNDGATSDMTSVILKEPFKDHVASTVKIITNRVYKLNNNDINNVPFKVTIPGRRLLNFSMNSTEDIAKGDICVVAIYGQDNTTTASAYKITMSCKICYTDA